MINLKQKDRKTFEQIAAVTTSVQPFVGDTPGKQSARLKKALRNDWQGFSFFARTYFPHVFALPFAGFHQEMFEKAHHFNGLTALTGFRGAGKTVLMGVVYPVWCLARGARYIVHVSSDISASGERTEFTYHQLTQNVRIKYDFPDLTPTESTDDGYYLKNNALIKARSIKQAIRGTFNPHTGTRPDLFVCDDIDREENIGNISIGKRRMNKIIRELGGALAPKGLGKVFWLGNLVHPNFGICQLKDMIINEIKANDPGFDEKKAAHLSGHGKQMLRFPLEDATGKSIWEEQYPTTSLPALRAEYGLSGYQQEFLGIPVIEGNRFKYEWFTYWQTLPPQLDEVWLYADPAWGEKGCFKAIIAAGWDGFQFYILKTRVRQEPNHQFFRAYYDIFAELTQKYGPVFRAAQETSFGQARVIDEFDRWSRDNGLNPIGMHINHIESRGDKIWRINTLEPVITSGRVRFCEGQDTPVLISQLLTFPDGYIDACDALHGCLNLFDAYKPQEAGIAYTVIRFSYEQ